MPIVSTSGVSRLMSAASNRSFQAAIMVVAPRALRLGLRPLAGQIPLLALATGQCAVNPTLNRLADFQRVLEPALLGQRIALAQREVRPKLLARMCECDELELCHCGRPDVLQK